MDETYIRSQLSREVRQIARTLEDYASLIKTNAEYIDAGGNPLGALQSITAALYNLKVNINLTKTVSLTSALLNEEKDKGRE